MSLAEYRLSPHMEAEGKRTYIGSYNDQLESIR